MSIPDNTLDCSLPTQNREEAKKKKTGAGYLIR